MIDRSISLEKLNKTNENTLADHLGIEFTELTSDYLKARMFVDARTHQQLGMMHGGASASLAEMTGSMAAYLSIDRDKFFCVGLELKINHIKAVREGFVTAIAESAHLGNQTHVWQIKTYDEKNDLVALSTLTMAILPLDEQTKYVIGDIFKRIS